MRADRPNRIVRVAIRGRVQGVGFRAWTRRKAEQFGLRGWVQNRRDGSVEAVFAGPDAAVAGMLEACREGPAHARVEDLRSEAMEPDEVPDLPDAFEERRSV